MTLRLQGRRTHRPEYIDVEVWERLADMSFVQVADHVDDLEEALRGQRRLNEALLAQNSQLRQKVYGQEIR